jgi:hypothetical protein
MKYVILALALALAPVSARAADSPPKTVSTTKMAAARGFRVVPGGWHGHWGHHHHHHWGYRPWGYGWRGHWGYRPWGHWHYRWWF